MSTPYNSKYAAIPIPDLENWNTDRTVDVPIMLRGNLVKGPGGWTYDTGEVPNYTTIVDQNTDYVMYLGKAIIGSNTSATSWQIKRVSSTSADYMSIQWGGGVDTFTNIWNNRTLLTYS
jgi:hypothetical protein